MKYQSQDIMIFLTSHTVMNLDKFCYRHEAVEKPEGEKIRFRTRREIYKMFVVVGALAGG